MMKKLALISLLLSPLFLFAEAGFNVPIELPLPNYRSLEVYAKQVGGTQDFHMTLVFTQMSKPFADAERGHLQKEIRQDATIQARAKEFELAFTHFTTLGPALTAVYQPVDPRTGQATAQAQASLDALVSEIRRLVRRISNHYAGKGSVTRTTIQTPSGPQELATLNNKPLYQMDLRPLIPHVTVKYQPTPNDLQTLQGALAPPIKNLEVRVNTLQAKKTKSITL